jgi:predicted ribosomally synthesized peptide with SipW-like signal peptide
MIVMGMLCGLASIAVCTDTTSAWFTDSVTATINIKTGTWRSKTESSAASVEEADAAAEEEVATTPGADEDGTSNEVGGSQTVNSENTNDADDTGVNQYDEESKDETEETQGESEGNHVESEGNPVEYLEEEE